MTHPWPPGEWPEATRVLGQEQQVGSQLRPPSQGGRPAQPLGHPRRMDPRPLAAQPGSTWDRKLGANRLLYLESWAQPCPASGTGTSKQEFWVAGSPVAALLCCSLEPHMEAEAPKGAAESKYHRDLKWKWVPCSPEEPLQLLPRMSPVSTRTNQECITLQLEGAHSQSSVASVLRTCSGHPVNFTSCCFIPDTTHA